MKRFAIYSISLFCIYSQTVFAEPLSSRKTQHFIKDFYKAIQHKDAQTIDSMIADNANVNLHLSKMNQSFSLNKHQYLQQMKAAWHFGKNEKYKLSDIKYTLTQAGLSANISLQVNESRHILDEDLTQTQEMSIDLTLIDEQIKISAIKSTSNL